MTIWELQQALKLLARMHGDTSEVLVDNNRITTGSLYDPGSDQSKDDEEAGDLLRAMGWHWSNIRDRWESGEVSKSIEGGSDEG